MRRHLACRAKRWSLVVLSSTLVRKVMRAHARDVSCGVLLEPLCVSQVHLLGQPSAPSLWAPSGIRPRQSHSDSSSPNLGPDAGAMSPSSGQKKTAIAKAIPKKPPLESPGRQADA